MFAWFIYCTSAITSYQFGTSDPLSKAYNDGADWVGVLNSRFTMARPLWWRSFSR